MQPMRTFYLLALTVCLALGSASVHAADAKAALFVNLTSVDPHRVEMALNLTEAAVGQGHATTVFLNIDAVRIAEKDNSMFEPSRAHLERAIKAGAKVIVCPHCMHYAGLKETNLIPGVKIGNPDEIFSALFAPDTRVMTW